MPCWPRSSGEPLNQARPIRHVLPDRALSVVWLHPLSQKHPDRTLQDKVPVIPASRASLPAHHRSIERAPLSGFPFFLCLWEDIIAWQLEGDKWLILANGLWVEITHVIFWLEHLIASTRLSRAFFPGCNGPYALVIWFGITRRSWFSLLLPLTCSRSNKLV